MFIYPRCTLVAVKHTEVAQRDNLAVRSVEMDAGVHLGAVDGCGSPTLSRLAGYQPPIRGERPFFHRPFDPKPAVKQLAC